MGAWFWKTAASQPKQPVSPITPYILIIFAVVMIIGALNRRIKTKTKNKKNPQTPPPPPATTTTKQASLCIQMGVICWVEVKFAWHRQRFRFTDVWGWSRSNKVTNTFLCRIRALWTFWDITFTLSSDLSPIRTWRITGLLLWAIFKEQQA